MAWVQQASPEEHEDWKVLATFVKCYSNLYCKAQKPGDHHFDQDIIQLNELFETLSDKEITKMIDIRFVALRPGRFPTRELRTLPADSPLANAVSAT
ncbi:MAG: hypothetical protein IPH05_10965 [Flavobacteriales bacterium]|nr:hypothetical protein [Flavobacteriales bacterium]